MLGAPEESRIQPAGTASPRSWARHTRPSAATLSAMSSIAPGTPIEIGLFVSRRSAEPSGAICWSPPWLFTSRIPAIPAAAIRSV